MSDDELEALKRKRLLELQRRMASRQEKPEPIDACKFLMVFLGEELGKYLTLRILNIQV